MQKGIFTRIKIALVKFRDTYFTGVQRIFRYSQRLEAKLDELETLHFALKSEVQNLKKELTRKNNELKSTLAYAKINQALMNLEEKFTRKKDFDLNTFILFDYSNHTHRNYHNLGDFVQTIAVCNAVNNWGGGGI
ncbi:MAG: hypothetical protein J1E31_00930, partial [Helicobacter sp.]|nr:hypothetical protein [Helicobacter sp.]